MILKYRWPALVLFTCFSLSPFPTIVGDENADAGNGTIIESTEKVASHISGNLPESEDVLGEIMIEDGHETTQKNVVHNCEDSKERFTVEGLEDMKSCVWAARTQTPSRCKLEEVQANCPVTCGICPSKQATGKGKGKGSTKGTKSMPSMHPSSSPSRSISPSMIPTIADSSQPSYQPSPQPSVQFSEFPSDLPTYQPSACEDEEDWVMPADSVWKERVFVGKNCSDLEAFVLPAQYNEWCSFLSQGIHSAKSPNEACCFCGGGRLIEPQCNDLEWTDLEGFNIDCVFIEQSTDPQRFCDVFGDDHFSADGLSLNDACCVCGGGSRNYGQVGNGGLDNADVRMKVDPLVIEDDEGAESTQSSSQTIFRDYIFREGLGESPGVPNLEYLGIGYDALFGNPRGADDSELDPGFRHRILRLRLQQTELTVDQEFMVPLGTELKYTSSCKYDSKSREVSSESDLRQTLSEEASFTESASASLSFGATSLISAFSASMQTSQSFSKSSKFEATTSTSLATNTVSFEARAICSEYEAAFSPYADQELDPNFKKALSSLPVPYNGHNPRNRAAYEKFFGAYGTNYVRQVVLGGKRVYTTSMSSQDYSSLVSKSVDVASSMTYEMSAAMGASQQVNAGLVKGAANVASTFGGPKAAAVGSIVNIALDEVDNDEVLFGRNVEASSSYNIAQFASNRKQAEDAIEISETKLDKTEVTIGGLPDEEWRSWAATVKEKPMPIRYKLGSLMEFMSYEQSVAFTIAFEDIFGVDLKYRPSNTIFDNAFHLGVYGGGGEPLAASSVNPNASYRALLQLGTIPRESKPVNSVEFEIFNDDYGETEYSAPFYVSDDNKVACGVQVKYEEIKTGPGGFDDEGIVEIYLKYCDKDDWYQQTEFEKISEKYGKGGTTFFADNTCDENEYIDGMHIRYCGENSPGDLCEQENLGNSDDLLGIHGIKISCNVLGGDPATRTLKLVHCKSRPKESKEDTKCKNDSSWKKKYLPLSMKDNKAIAIKGGKTRMGDPVSKGLEVDNVGLVGLAVFHKEVDVSGEVDQGPTVDIITYSETWKGKINRPIATFATTIRLDIAPDDDEEDDAFGFIAEVGGNQRVDYVNNVPFAISQQTNSAGSIAVTNFGRKLTRSKLQSFTFLSAENIQKYYGDIIAGVIRYDGVVLNKRVGIDIGFKVKKKKSRKFLTTFTTSFDSSPTVLVFPKWFTDDGRFYPDTIADVSCALAKVDTNGFEVTYGDSGSLDRSYFGLNFLVIDPNVPTVNLKHGTILHCTESKFQPGGMTQHLYGLQTPECKKKNQETSVAGFTGYTGGVLIEFDEPFDSLPSVILTPIYEGPIADPASVPRCIIESLTEESVYVKCGVIKSSSTNVYTYDWIPFTIAAVGPHKIK